MRVLRFVMACLGVLIAPAAAKTSLVVLPPDYSGDKQALMRQLDALAGLGPEDRILIYASRPPALLATITRPVEPGLNNARFKARLAAQFAPVKAYLATLPVQTAGEPSQNLMLTEILDEIGRNVIPSLPEKHADVLLIGGLIYFDRNSRWSMTERYYPSDGLLRASRTEVPFGIAGAQTRLTGGTFHFCSVGGESEFATAEHREQVRRFWWLWINGQSGRVGTFSSDLATCFRRFLAGETSGQAVYQSIRDAKPEMLRARAPIPTSLPDSMDRPGEWVFRADVPISRTPPATSIGTAWIGLKWNAPGVDIDLYARAGPSSAWLYYGQVRTAEGYFNKDFQSETDGQWEFVEFSNPIDLAKAQVAINFYAGNLPTGPEGILRVWFDRRVYEMPFKLSARSGNRGGMPMSGGQHWLNIDLRKVVGLPAEAAR